MLRERCEEVGRPFESIERTATGHYVIRDTAAAAEEAWSATAARHGLAGRVGSDGTDRGLTAGGSPAEIADYVAGFRGAGVGEVMFVFRDPFDLETIERIGEVKQALEGVAA